MSEGVPESQDADILLARKKLASSTGGFSKGLKRPRTVRSQRQIAIEALEKANNGLHEAQLKVNFTLNREYNKEVKGECITNSLIKIMDRIYKIVRDRVSPDTMIAQQHFEEDDVLFRIHFQHGQKNKTVDTLETLYVSGQLAEDGKFCLYIYQEQEVAAQDLKTKQGMIDFLGFVNRACNSDTAATEEIQFTDDQLYLLHKITVVALMYDICGRAVYLNTHFPSASFIDSNLIRQYMVQTL